MGLLNVFGSLYIGELGPFFALNQPLAARVVDMTQGYCATFSVDKELRQPIIAVVITTLTHRYRGFDATLITVFILLPIDGAKLLM